MMDNVSIGGLGRMKNSADALAQNSTNQNVGRTMQGVECPGLSDSRICAQVSDCGAFCQRDYSKMDEPTSLGFCNFVYGKPDANQITVPPAKGITGRENREVVRQLNEFRELPPITGPIPVVPPLSVTVMSHIVPASAMSTCKTHGLSRIFS